MLSSIRRQFDNTSDDFHCLQCGMPLLRADSRCPSCDPAPAKKHHRVVIDPYDEDYAPTPVSPQPSRSQKPLKQKLQGTLNRVWNEMPEDSSMLTTPIIQQINWGSWQEFVTGLLWTLATVGILYGTVRLYLLDGFQAMVLFQFSGIIFLGTHAYKRMLRLENTLRQIRHDLKNKPIESEQLQLFDGTPSTIE